MFCTSWQRFLPKTHIIKFLVKLKNKRCQCASTSAPRCWQSNIMSDCFSPATFVSLNVDKQQTTWTPSWRDSLKVCPWLLRLAALFCLFRAYPDLQSVLLTSSFFKYTLIVVNITPVGLRPHSDRRSPHIHFGGQSGDAAKMLMQEAPAKKFLSLVARVVMWTECFYCLPRDRGDER